MSGWLLALALLFFGDHLDATYGAWQAKAEQIYAAIETTAQPTKTAIGTSPDNGALGPALASGVDAAERLFGEGIAAYRVALLNRPRQADIGPLLAKGAGVAVQIIGHGVDGYRAAMCNIPPPRQAGPRDRDLGSLISEASSRFDLPELWIRAVMQVESEGAADATSPKGAMGLMQVMPATYAYLSDRYGLGGDPYAPRDNLLAGSAYLRELYDRYGAAGFLAAYNAGPGRYEDSFCRGCSLPAETKRYVAAVRLAVGDLLFANPHSRFYQPIAIAPDGALKLARGNEPMPAAERLALHSLIERAARHAGAK